AAADAKAAAGSPSGNQAAPNNAVPAAVRDEAKKLVADMNKAAADAGKALPSAAAPIRDAAAQTQKAVDAAAAPAPAAASAAAPTPLDKALQQAADSLHKAADQAA